MAQGFTLIEMMIAVAIVAVLASIAFPAFQDSIRKGRRADAFAGLTAVQQAQERWRANNPSYASNAQLTLGVNADPPGLGLLNVSAGGYYDIVISGNSGAGYTATASAAAGKSQALDGNCAQLRVQVVGGNILHLAAPVGGEFTEGSGNRCWVR
ncbi:MAG: type IV pilin protein [Rubrivivax sp.]|nr:type IV pilin protein [Rubrivivax sp.]